MDIFVSPLVGNTIGVISLLVGVAGLIITIKTMKSAKRIEADMKKAQISALNKKRFHKLKDVAVRKLEKRRKATQEERIISLKYCNDILVIINDLKGYSSILFDEDQKIAEESWKKLKEIASSIQSVNYQCTNDNVVDFDAIYVSGEERTDKRTRKWKSKL